MVVADLCVGDLAEDAKAKAGLKWLLAGGAVIGDPQDQVGVGLVGVELDRAWLGVVVVGVFDDVGGCFRYGQG
jgi:hypothetical protein